MSDQIDFTKILETAQAKAASSVETFTEVGTDGGPCGFAWVRIDKKSDFAKWCRSQLKRAGYRHDAGGNLRYIENDKLVRDGVVQDKVDRFGYPSHISNKWEFWNPSKYRGQAVYPKEIGARAFATVLNEFGIPASYDSRLD